MCVTSDNYWKGGDAYVRLMYEKAMQNISEISNICGIIY